MPRGGRIGLAVLAALAYAAPAAAAPGDMTFYDIPVETTPYGVTRGPDDRIWFADSGNHVGGASVGRMSTDGTIATADVVPMPTDELAGGVVPGPDGNLWVRQGEHVSRVPPTADETSDIDGWSTSNSGGWGHIAPGPDGRLWFSVDTAVGAISTAGGTAVDYPSGASGLTADTLGFVSGPDGKVWFANQLEIRRMSTTGVVGPGDVFPLPSGHEYVTDMTMGPDGNIWFTLSLPAAVGKITPGGTITTFPTPTPSSGPFGITAGPDGHMWFAESSIKSIASIPLDATTADPGIVEYPIGGDATVVLDIVAGADDRVWAPLFNRNQLVAVETNRPPVVTPPGDPPPEPPGPQPEPPLPGPPGPGLTPPPSPLPANPPPVGCVPDRLILTDVFPSGGRTRILGVAPAAAVGRSVTIRSSWNGRTVARAVVAADRSFAATTPLPPRALRSSNRARYVAVLGATRSQALKFARRMYTTSLTASGRTLRFAGVVTRPLASPPRPVVLRASATCAGIGRGTVVATTTPSRSGAFTASFELPATLASAPAVYLRAQTRVPKAGARRRKLFGTFTLVRGIRTNR